MDTFLRNLKYFFAIAIYLIFSVATTAALADLPLTLEELINNQEK